MASQGRAIVPRTAAKRKLDDLDGMAAVRLALEALHLEVCAHAFEEAGFDDLDYIRSMGPDDLKTLGEEVRMRPGHFHKLCDFLPDLDARIAVLKRGPEAASNTSQSTANGLSLHLSCKSPTGYTNVFAHPSGCFKARQPGGTRIIGTFATAIEAAMAYADAVAKTECEVKDDEDDRDDEQQEAKHGGRLAKSGASRSSWPAVAGPPPPLHALPPDVADDAEASEVYEALQRLKADGVEQRLIVRGYEMAYHLRGNRGGKADGGYWNARAAPIKTRGGNVITFPAGKVRRERLESAAAPAHAACREAVCLARLTFSRLRIPNMAGAIRDRFEAHPH